MAEAPILSFPAILRNPGLNSRFAHLHAPTSDGTGPKQPSAKSAVRTNRRGDNEGKRWVRRKENARFVGNPHVVAASRKDYNLQVPQVQSTFPEPLPPYLPRVVKLATAPNLPALDPSSANAGRFSLSLKGMRRDLRRAGGRAQALVRDVESEMVNWLTHGGTVLSPDAGSTNKDISIQGTPIGSTGTIFEISRTPQKLLWRIEDDRFARYVVHCCARYHEVVSFSKSSDEGRLTYLLRPNVTHPDRRAEANLETPPVTDIDYSSNPETDSNIDSDFVSDKDMDSDVELDTGSGLSIIDESPSSHSASLPPVEEGEWSHIEEDHIDLETDADDFESGSEFGSAMSASIDIIQSQLETISLENTTHIGFSTNKLQDASFGDTEESVDPDKTITAIRGQQHIGVRSRDWASTRSASSPSRSPARRRVPRRRGAKKRLPIGLASGLSFYDYLFS